MVAGYAESIAELLRERLAEQIRSVERLRAVAERERELLQKRDLDRVIQQEAEKEKLVEVIRQRDREIETLRRAWQKNIGHPAAGEVEALLSRLGEQVRQLIEVEGDNVTIVRQLRDEVEAELRKLMGMRQGGGYPPANQVSGRFVDTEA
ncbi:MAG: hypothetical protein ONB23_05540 [candidate division KSB1 bacterium]|nr:hypothetical protein [candidate division KSB1 bacterium]